MNDDKEALLINEFITQQKIARSDVVCSSGDDAAVMRLDPEYEITATVDCQIYGTHFDDRFTPYDVGYKALAVNLSDIAAMGAQPLWAMISLSVKNFDAGWVKNFSQGFCELAAKYNVECVGGNVSKGQLSAHVTLIGKVKKSLAVRQDGALLGDGIYVTGSFGGAAWAWQNTTVNTKEQKAAYNAWKRPVVNVDFAVEVCKHINAATDVSDGLYVDLARMLNKSKLGAKLFLNNCPYHEVLHKLDPQVASDYAWSGGESYQLVFTCSDKNISSVQEIANKHGVCLNKIGTTIEVKNIEWVVSGSRPAPNLSSVFTHF